MSNSAQTFDCWPREELRLLSGFLLVGFAILFWVFFSHQPELSSAASLVVYVLVGASLLVGLAIILFRRLIIIDPVHRQASRVVLLHRVVIHSTSWPLDSFRCILARHGTDEGSYVASVALRHSSGTEVWLRSFQCPKVGLSEEAAAFIRHLSEMTGLQYEEKMEQRGACT